MGGMKLSEEKQQWTEEQQIVRNLKREQEEKMREALVTVEYIRPEIMKFAEAMERLMRTHDSTKGDSWKICDIIYLFQKLEEEKHEIDDEFYEYYFKKEKNKGRINSELIDIANIVMMIWNREE